MKSFLLVLFVILVFSSLITGFFFFKLPPTDEEGIIYANLIYFLLFLWVSLASASTLMLYFASFSFTKAKFGIAALNRPKILLLKSLRRGLIFSLAVCLLLTLRAFGLGNLLNSILLIGVFVLFEAYLSNR